MNANVSTIRQYVLAPATTLLFVGVAAAVVNAAKPDDLVATDGKVEIEDGRYTQMVVREASFTPGETLRVETKNGQITVAGWDKDTVHVEAVKRVERRVGGIGWIFNKLSIPLNDSSETTIEDYVTLVSVDLLQEDGGMLLKAEAPTTQAGINLRVDYTIHLPNRANLNLKTSNGRVNVSNIQGEVTSRTSNGRVDYADILGAASARTSNGRVTIAGVDGPVVAATSNGRVDITHDGPLADHPIECETSNGSITVALAEGSTFAVDARTSNGRVHSTFLVDGAADERKRHLVGTVGGGGPEVRLRTSNGSIHLEAR